MSNSLQSSAAANGTPSIFTSFSSFAAPALSGPIAGPDNGVRNFVPRQNKELPSQTLTTSSGSEKIEIPDKLFSALVDLKVSWVLFAMHLKREVRSAYFSRLDEILDADEWDSDDQSPSVESFQDFVRGLIFFDHPWQPQLALNQDGTFAACWYERDFRLTFEFIGRRRIRWIVSCVVAGSTEIASGVCEFGRAPAVLAAYTAGRRVFHAGK